MRHKGGGHKNKYRLIDFKRNKLDIATTVERIEYDTNRTAQIALSKYKDGDKAYLIAPKDERFGERILSGEADEIKKEKAMKIKY